MIKNYFITAIRNMLRHKGFSLINILGLAIGLAAFLLITIFVRYELSFDGMHKKNIYRLDEVQSFEGMVAPQNVALSMYPMASTLNAEFPEITKATHIYGFEKYSFNNGEKKIYLPKIFMADSSFLQVFDFPLVHGDRATALTEPTSLLLTEESAAKIFGKENPIGKTIVHYGGDTVTFKVTGILKNIPKNSHLQFDGIASFKNIEDPEWLNGWGGNWVNTYLELAPNTNIAALESKFPAYLRKHKGEEGVKNYKLFLQSLKTVHAGSVNVTHDYNNFQKFDSRYTYIFSILAILVLVIACINFINLSTALSSSRAKEVGIRKSVGAFRLQVAGQFIGESILVSLFALVVALGIIYLSLPFLRNLTERDLQLPLSSQPIMFLFLIGLAIAVGFLSGLYPAAFLSRFNPSRVLKGLIENVGGRPTMRNTLVIGQFSAAIILIIGTLLATQQLIFMQRQPTGFNREQVVIIPLSRIANQKYDALKQELLKNTAITGVTGSGQRLGNNFHQSNARFKSDSGMRELTTSQVLVDFNYLAFYNIQLLEGRNFSEGRGDNGRGYIINESMAKELLKDKPGTPLRSLIGKSYAMGWEDSLGTIIGIAKDFNFNSLHHKIETLTMEVKKEWGYSEMSVRIDGNHAQQALNYISNVWSKMVPDLFFDYTFLDDHFAKLYQSDKQVSVVMSILAGLAIFIACLGLFGLATFTAQRRTKEIGIRKVVGASVFQITALLSKDFLKLVLISFIIAVPVAWIGMSKWLEDFAYRINISVWVFVVAGICAIAIALLTISFQSIKAALANPVKSLRSE